MYSWPYPSTTALTGFEHRYSWLEKTDNIVSISPKQTGQIPVTISSAGLSAGTWTGSVNVISLNSNTNPIPVAVKITVLPGTDIETAREINFGIRYSGVPVDTTIIVENRGSTDLSITQIQSNDARVHTSLSSMTLVPGQKNSLKVTINTPDIAVIDANITFTSNDPDEGVLVVPVKVDIREAPSISVNPQSLEATLRTGESTELSLTIQNTGKSTLRWNATLTGSDPNALEPEFQQNNIQAQSATVQKTELGDFVQRASSPVPITCLSYDPDGKSIYAKAIDNNTLYKYDPALDSWKVVGPVPLGVLGQPSCLNGKIYHGGLQLNVYTIQTNSWRTIAFPVQGITAQSLTNDDRYIYVGIGKQLYRFDPETESWLELAPSIGASYITGFGGLSYHGGVIYAHMLQAIQGSGNTFLHKYFIESNTWLESANVISGKATFSSAIDISTARYFVLGAPDALPAERIQMSILDMRFGEWSKIKSPFDFGTLTGLVFVGQENVSGVYFTQGDRGTKFAVYKTATAPNWFEMGTTQGELSADESQTIGISLNAGRMFSGVYRGSVKVYSTNPPIEANIPLKVTINGQPDASLTTMYEGFREVILGNTGSNRIIIKNVGTAPLVVESVSTNDPDFTVSQTAFTVQVGESVGVPVSFRPSAAGLKVGTYTFHTSAPSQRSEISIAGTGVYPAQLVVPTATIEATLFTGATSKRKITIQNSGNGATQYLVLQSQSPWIKLDSVGYARNVGALQSREYEIRLSADGLSQGVYEGDLQVEDYRDPLQAVYQVPVRMNVVNGPNLLLSDSVFNFGEQHVKSSYDSIVQIKNNGIMPLSISSIQSDNAAFTINVSAPLTINPGESIEATVRFFPTAIGEQFGLITFTSPDAGQTDKHVTLKGAGIIPPAFSSSDSQITLTAFENEAEVEAVNFTNSGGSKLNWTIFNESSSTTGFFQNKVSPSENGFPFQVTALATDESGLIYAQAIWYQNWFSYNPQTSVWQKIGHAPYIQNAKNSTALFLNQRMYTSYAEHPSKLYVYDMTLKHWEIKTNPFGFASANITTDGNVVYLAGGGKFVRYNPKTSTWTELPIPTFKLDGLGGLTYFEGVIYAHAAGSNGFARYTIATGVWENLIPLPDKASLGSAVDPTLKRYYAYGNGYLYEYDMTAKIWTVRTIPIFKTGDEGGLLYSPKDGGIYLLQGKPGKGFGMYKPGNQLAWLRSSQLAGEIGANENQTIGINCSAATLTTGTYYGSVHINTNDPDNAALKVPVTFHVKNAAPNIDVPSSLSRVVDRVTTTSFYVLVKNSGRQMLSWNISTALPTWLAVSKISGNLSENQTDSLRVSFLPALFSGAAIADHTMEIDSNDPAQLKSLIRFALTIQNNVPAITAPIPDQVLTSDLLEIPLTNHFADADNDLLNFTISSNNAMIATNIEDTKLVIRPMQVGITTVTVSATDPYNASAVAMFQVNNLITGIEKEDNTSGFSSSPNPFENKTKINFGKHRNGKANLDLVDVTGKAMWKSGEIDLALVNDLELDLSNFSAGVYILRLFVMDKLTDSIRLIGK